MNLPKTTLKMKNLIHYNSQDRDSDLSIYCIEM